MFKTFLPATRWGKWSIGLSVGVFVLLFLNPIIIRLATLIGGRDLSGDPTLLAVIGILLVVCSAAAFLTGVISIVMVKERALLVIVAVLFNFVYLVFAFDTIFSR